ncbi:MAG: S8 family serine peptidase, partial [Chloroflexi bacterium]|nr:S8 family serine peptidase [Chloroflexota bacterium]
TTGSSSVVIALLDSGVDMDHPDLKSQMLPGFNSADGGTNVTDALGHGTHVAGIAGAAGGNGMGIAGAAYGAKLLPVKVIGADGNGGDSSVAAGIKWAADNGAKIINMSLGGPDTTPPSTVQDAVNYAYNKGVLLVAASGNCFKDGSSCDGLVNPVIYPAALNNVVSVSALNNRDVQASYSQTHATVKLAAPGGDDPAAGETAIQSAIVSTFPRALDASGYKIEAGTSQAAPLVSGVAALVWSANPALTNKEVEDILTRTATHLGDPGRNPVYGYGKVNAQAAVQAAKAMVAPTPTPTPTASPTPNPTGSAPALAGPADNAALTGLSAALAWQNPAGTVQFQLQVTPANNDGPAINLIIGAPDQVAAAKFDVAAPVFGQRPYIILPGMSYQWRVRTTTFAGPVSESSPQWGPWSPAKRFRTPAPSASTLSPVSPADGATAAAGQATVQWADSNPSAFYYEVQMSGDTRFDANPATATSFVYWNLVHGGVPTPPRSWRAPTGGLPAASTVFWRVRPRVQGDGTEVAWGPTWSFKTP